MWLFAGYTLAYYGPIVAEHGLPGLNATRLPKAYTPGATVANLSIAVHLADAVVIGAFGALQFVPLLRSRFPVFHRWNGRVFLALVVLASLSGLYMTWIRGSSAGDFGQHLGLSANGVANIGCAGIDWQTFTGPFLTALN